MQSLAEALAVECKPFHVDALSATLDHLSKLLVYVLRTAPRFLKIRIMHSVMAGFTRQQVRA